MRHPDHTSFFFFNDTATTEIYTLSLHDALPISSKTSYQIIRCEAPTPTIGASGSVAGPDYDVRNLGRRRDQADLRGDPRGGRSEEHTSELQSLRHLVCRLLLEKKKNKSHDGCPC